MVWLRPTGIHETLQDFKILSANHAMLPKNGFSVFDHLVGLVPKVLNNLTNRFLGKNLRLAVDVFSFTIL